MAALRLTPILVLELMPVLPRLRDVLLTTESLAVQLVSWDAEAVVHWATVLMVVADDICFCFFVSNLSMNSDFWAEQLLV